jgi:hypothetical protein
MMMGLQYRVVDWLNAADGGDPVVIEKARIEAAHVVSSLCYGLAWI